MDQVDGYNKLMTAHFGIWVAKDTPAIKAKPKFKF